MTKVQVDPGTLAALRTSIEGEGDGIGELVSGLSASDGAELTLGTLPGAGELCGAIGAIGTLVNTELGAAKWHLYEIASGLDVHRSKAANAEEQNADDARRTHNEMSRDPGAAAWPSSGEPADRPGGRCDVDQGTGGEEL